MSGGNAMRAGGGKGRGDECGKEGVEGTGDEEDGAVEDEEEEGRWRRRIRGWLSSWRASRQCTLRGAGNNSLVDQDPGTQGPVSRLQGQGSGPSSSLDHRGKT